MFTEEMVQIAKEAADAGELLAMAKEHGIEMTAEEAAEKFALLHAETGEISDDELDNVSGGGCGSKKKKNTPDSLFNVGDSVCIIARYNPKLITHCYGTVVNKKYSSGKWIYGVNCIGVEYFEEHELRLH